MPNGTEFRACKHGGLASEPSHEHHQNLGMLLLAIYLILVGITTLLHFALPGIVIALLALAAGILILIGK